MRRSLTKYLTIFLSITIAAIPLAAQSMATGILQDMKQSGQTSRARAGDIDIENDLRKDLRKKQEELRKLVDYIPLEGALDEDEYIIGPGDQFFVSFAGAVEERYVAAVGADGTIVLPYTKGIRISESTLREAKDLIVETLSQIYKEEDICVSLAAARLFVVHATGFVAMPGGYTVTAADRLHSAVEVAGGYLQSANISRIEIYRGADTIEVDLTGYTVRGDLADNPYLRDGDVIFVPGFDYRSPWVFVSGGGYSGGVVEIEAGEDVRGMMSRVGIDRENIDRSNISLAREGEKYSIDLLSMPENIGLSRGDSLFIPVLPDSVYVGGRVVRGGPVAYIAGEEYMAYIAMAGGISKEGSLRHVKIYRKGEKLSPRKAGDVMRGDAIIVGTDNFYYVTEFMKMLGQIGTFASAVYIIGFKD